MEPLGYRAFPKLFTDRPNAPCLLVKEGSVRFENVYFGYEKDRQILKGLDLDVPAGFELRNCRTIGRWEIDRSHALHRFYDPSAGRILIDDQDISEVAQKSLRSAIGIVPQDTVLFNETIGYNIGYGRNGATTAEIEDAAGRTRSTASSPFFQSIMKPWSANAD